MVLQVLFDWVDSHGGEGMPEPGRYNLATQYPRRVFRDEDGQQSIGDAGLTGGQQVLFVEARGDETPAQGDDSHEAAAPLAKS